MQVARPAVLWENQLILKQRRIFTADVWISRKQQKMFPLVYKLDNFMEVFPAGFVDP